MLQVKSSFLLICYDRLLFYYFGPFCWGDWIILRRQDTLHIYFHTHIGLGCKWNYYASLNSNMITVFEYNFAYALSHRESEALSMLLNFKLCSYVLTIKSTISGTWACDLTARSGCSLYFTATRRPYFRVNGILTKIFRRCINYDYCNDFYFALAPRCVSEPACPSTA